MKTHYRLFALLGMVGVFLLLSCNDESSVDHVTMNVSYDPAPVRSDGVMNIAYCVDLSDYTLSGLTLIKAAIIDNDTGTVVALYKDSALDEHMVMASYPYPTDEEKTNGTKKQNHPVFYSWLKLNSDEVPQQLYHEFSFIDENNIEITKWGAMTRVIDAAPVVISPPMRGDGWFTMETTELQTHHFKNEVTHNGNVYCPERFAVDYLQVDSDNNFYNGDENVCENWICYGKELVAVADGIVTAIHDGVPDNTTVGVIFNLEFQDMAGNYVILDIGNNHYAAYCHIMPGSIQVAVGDRVRKGDTIGLIGNSGNSGAPHLHFQITDASSFYASDGLPYVFDTFTVIGSATLDPVIEDFIVTRYATPENKYYEMPENLKLLSFDSPDTAK